jgi:hypothetical protein
MSRKTKAPSNADIWTRIKTKQDELHVLYQEATQDIYKGTEGDAFLGEKNVFYAQYWLGAVKKSPKAVTGEFDLDDFEVKADLFPKFIEVYNNHNANSALLEDPYNFLSKDVLRYATDARKSFSISNDPVCKQAIKDAPRLRKLPASKTDDNAPNDGTADKATTEHKGEPSAS